MAKNSPQNKANLNFMKRYLRNVITFEKYIYIWSNLLDYANVQKTSLMEEGLEIEKKRQGLENTFVNIDTDIEENTKRLKSEIERCRRSIKKKKIGKILISSIIAAALALIFIFCGLKHAIISGILVAELCFAASLFIPQNIEQELICKYTEELQNNVYNVKEVKRHKKFLSEKIKSLDEEYFVITEHIKLASENRERAITSLDSARKTMEQIYALDVLPEKYRSFNAAATLYEYLEMGICTSIQGHGGIYETYEEDLTYGVVFEKLEDISKNIECIVDTQCLLYDELTDANRTLKDIEADFDNFIKVFDDETTASLQLQSQALAMENWKTWQNL